MQTEILHCEPIAENELTLWWGDDPFREIVPATTEGVRGFIHRTCGDQEIDGGGFIYTCSAVGDGFHDRNRRLLTVEVDRQNRPHVVRLWTEVHGEAEARRLEAKYWPEILG